MQKAFADFMGIILKSLPQKIKRFVVAGSPVCKSKSPRRSGCRSRPEGKREAGPLLEQLVLAWRDLPVRQAATYLGCLSGPGKGGQEWTRACSQDEDRARVWQWSSMGLHFVAVVYNVYAHSVLSFTAQVARLNGDIREAETRGLRHAAPGPAIPQDHWHLKTA